MIPRFEPRRLRKLDCAADFARPNAGDNLMGYSRRALGVHDQADHADRPARRMPLLFDRDVADAWNVADSRRAEGSARPPSRA